MYSSELTKEELPKWHLATSRHATRVHSMKAMNMCLVFLSILCGLVGMGYVLFDPLVKHVILKKLVLTNSSDFAQIWKDPPISPHLKIYFFNLTNAPEFFDGKEKPNLVEVGPYTYHQKWIKENVDWHSNGTMSYSTRKIYTFMPELSVGDPKKDNVTTLNVPLLSAFYQKRNADYFTRLGLDFLLSSLGREATKAWVNRPVYDLLWGYDDALYGMAQLTADAPDTEKFGFFAEKNNSNNLPLYTMYTGEGNPYNLSQISLFNGNGHLKFWTEDKCNVVQGSDGATFNPYIQSNDTLWFFNDQLCRSIPLVFKKQINSLGLPGYRFGPRDDVFKSEKSYPENSCYCPDQTLCDMTGDGFFPVSACQFNAPIVLSWPHFLGANNSFLNAVQGLNPDEETHGFWFDVQPTTGTTLSAKARVQINLAIKKSDHFPQIGKIEDTVMPILWFEEGLDELGTDLVDMISEAVHSPARYKEYVFCVFIGLFMSFMVISCVAIIRIIINKRKRSREDNKLKSVREIIKSHSSNVDTTLEKPILNSNSSSGVGSSVESSRATSASHSRNTSTGSSNLQEDSASSAARPTSTLITMVKVATREDPEQLEKLLGDGKA